MAESSSCGDRASDPDAAPPPEQTPPPLGADAQAEKLRSSVFDQTWQAHLKSRDALIRDLTIALLLVVIFQVSSIPRSLGVIDREQTLLQERVARERAVATVRQTLQAQQLALAQPLNDGSDLISATVADARCVLRQRTASVDAQVARITGSPLPIDQSDLNAKCGTTFNLPEVTAETVQYNLTACPEIGADCRGELVSLQETVLDDVLSELNRRKRATIDDSLSLRRWDLVAGLRRQLWVLQSLTDPEASEQVRQVMWGFQWGSLSDQGVNGIDWQIDTIRKLRFDYDEDASISDWKGSILEPVVNSACGEGFLDTLASPPTATDRAEAQLCHSWGQLRERLGSADFHEFTDNMVDRAIDIVVAKRLDAQRQIEQSLAADVSELRENYSKPLPVSVLLEPEDAVRYFPLAVIATVTYFSTRYARWRRRGYRLAAAAESAGLTRDDLGLHLPDYDDPATSGAALSAASAKRYLPMAGALAIGAIAVFDMQQVMSRPALHQDEPLLAISYLTAAVVLALALTALWRVIARPAATTSRSLPTEGTAAVLLALVIAGAAVLGPRFVDAAPEASDAPARSPRIVGVQFFPNESLDDFLASSGEGEDRRLAAQLATDLPATGCTIKVELEPSDYRGAVLGLEWSLFAANGIDRRDVSWANNYLARELTPDATTGWPVAKETTIWLPAATCGPLQLDVVDQDGLVIDSYPDRAPRPNLGFG